MVVNRKAEEEEEVTISKERFHRRRLMVTEMAPLWTPTTCRMINLVSMMVFQFLELQQNPRHLLQIYWISQNLPKRNQRLLHTKHLSTRNQRLRRKALLCNRTIPVLRNHSHLCHTGHLHHSNNNFREHQANIQCNSNRTSVLHRPCNSSIRLKGNRNPMVVNTKLSAVQQR